MSTKTRAENLAALLERCYEGTSPVAWDPRKDAAAELRRLQAEVERLTAALAAERERLAALIARHTGLTLETLEYLETMRQGPTPGEWGEIDAAAIRAGGQDD